MSTVDKLREAGYLKVEPEGVVTANLEVAMRSLARAAATYELEGDDALAGAMWYQARALCNELGDRDYEMVVQGARHYAERVLTGHMNVTN